ncbi:Galactose-1-phosphate uridylyltransferase [Methylacidimicrobium sp. AP8]|uniref:galactose-1-phosphate uridylyltransferase n=1 Tax=Methylacidimicrobium sp. AP8 TaxID=2730359 RepID=UPI0018C18CB9|nr:DUF4931 domain-containing protein [Methylacidimicrobium sp. AP8]CAB4244368.1 Galactose-1-phosphate uridylyltransferase [Methylacidimicrobium sp. AP8]
MPQLRREPLFPKRWVVFAPERKQRPIDYPPPPEPSHTASPFVAGKESLTPHEVFAIRPGGGPPNSPGWTVRVVPNRFPALRIEGELLPEGIGIYDQMNGIGAHEVIIETPNPDQELEDQSVEGVTDVLRAYRARIIDLIQDVRFRYILLFKNVGLLAGASLRHPHSQLIALPVVPRVVEELLATSRSHFELKERSLFADVLQAELKSRERLVYENSAFVSFCPWASRFPFETWILPKFPAAHFHALDDFHLGLLAEVLRHVLRRIRKGLQNPAYNMILQTAPFHPSRWREAIPPEVEFRWHIEILPRLAQTAGFEYGTGFYINTTFPEEAADFLRRVCVES